MANPISVIIPAYRNAPYLDLCLRSLFNGQLYEHNEVIVIVDGYPDELLPTLKDYPAAHAVVFDENKGESVGHNTGVTLASNDRVLIVNADNVFPYAWDEHLSAIYNPECVIAPNQIEPRRSIFPSFLHAELGDTPDTFQYEAFVDLEVHKRSDRFTSDGGTWPVFMSKEKYMMLGGIDTAFPYTPFADWDFFLRAELAGLKITRYHGCLFYHFANPNLTAKQLGDKSMKEHTSAQYYEWKWGYPPTRDPKTNSRLNNNLRGICLTSN